MDINPLNLSYTIINMNGDSGKGKVISTEKNIHVIDDTLTMGRLAAVKHGNGRDWWVIAHEWESNRYYKLLITPDSINGPMSQYIGSKISYSDIVGQAKFSPDGSKYAMTGPDQKVDLFDFDRCTGDLYNFRVDSVSPFINPLLGLSFSPNSRFLYASNFDSIMQYDTWASNFAASRQTVAVWDSFYNPYATWFMFQQLAPDGRVYISHWGNGPALTYIEYPDSLGMACNVMQHAFPLPYYNPLALPNSPNWALGPLTGSICDTLTTGITDQTNHDFRLKIYPNPNDGNSTVNYQLP